MLAHRQAFDAQAERKAGPFFGVVADLFEDRRVDHAAAADLHPLRAFTQIHLHVEFGTRLGEGEVTRNEIDLCILTEHRASELVQRGLQVDHADLLVNVQALDLVEHRVVRRVVLVGTIHPAGRDDADGRLRRLLHHADLHGRRLRTQQRRRWAERVAEVEVVQRITRGVRLRDIQRNEVVPVVFDLRPLVVVKAHAGEDLDQLINRLADDVASAKHRCAGGLGDVEDRAGRCSRAGTAAEVCFLCLEGFLDGFLRGIGGLAEVTLLFFRDVLDPAHHALDRALGAEVLDAGLLQRIGVGDAFNRGEGFVFQWGNLL